MVIAEASGAQGGTADPQASGAADPSHCYLMVFEAGTSSVVHLPVQGEVMLGTSESASVRLRSPGVLPEHASLRLTEREAVLTRLADDGNVAINSEMLAGAQALTSGDVVILGEATIGFHRGSTAATIRASLDLARFRDRLDEEIERSLRYQKSTALLVIDPGSGAGVPQAQLADIVCGVVRRIDIVGTTERSEITVLFPETGSTAAIPARRILHAVCRVAPEARAGLAVCPEDGCHADTLLTGARCAMRAAAPADVGVVSSSASVVTVGDHEAIAVDPVMKNLFALIRQLAVSDLPVLINGETGVGKDIFAQALHAWSTRHGKRMVAINCAAVPESLLESELFGHEKGAFSGAIGSKPGLFEKAHGGTVFLDEVGDCSAMTQAKLLRVLETHRVSRVGGLEERPVDVRIVSATNRSLEDEIGAGRFRQDLFYRLNAAALLVPPLRDRPLDIPVLARAFLDAACDRLSRPRMVIARSAMHRLLLHAWPGNVRELKNVMDFVAASVSDTDLTSAQLPDRIAENVAPWMLPPGSTERTSPDLRSPVQKSSASAPRRFRNIAEEIAELEKTRMREALEETGGVRVRAAGLIGMPLRTFVTKLKAYGLGELSKGGDRTGDNQ